MSTAIKTFTKKRHSHPFIETEAGASSEESSEESSEGSSSEDSDELDENEYDMNDGFMVEDDDDSFDEMEPPSLKNDDVLYERRRAKMALDEVNVLKKKIETFKRRLKEVSTSRKRWRQRAHHIAERLNVCEQQLSQTTMTTDN